MSDVLNKKLCRTLCLLHDIQINLKLLKSNICLKTNIPANRLKTKVKSFPDCCLIPAVCLFLSVEYVRVHMCLWVCVYVYMCAMDARDRC